MSCREWKGNVALHAGGDLPPDRTARVESHLEGCGECRALWAELRASRALIEELRDEPEADALAAQVRRRVMARVTTPPASIARRYWKPALAAALVLAAVLSLSGPKGSLAPVARAPAPPRAQPAPAAVIVPVRQRAVRRRHRPPARRVQAVPEGPPLLVQFVTDDPNIVIYWLVDQKPQGD